MTNPRHINPSNENRAAHATYNFVPLPEKVLFADKAFSSAAGPATPWTMQDAWSEGLLSGVIELTIETLTPTFIRGTRSGDRSLPFLSKDGAGGLPVLPSSSQRGMFRTLYEILTFSKLQPVPERDLWFRSVGKDNLGDAYRTRREKPRLGVLHKSPDGWTVQPGDQVSIKKDLSGVPATPGSHSLFLKAGQEVISSEADISETQCPGFEFATCLVTGPMKGKQEVYAVLPNTKPPLPIPNALWEAFCSDEQMTQNQVEWYTPDGIPTDGDAIWYSERDDQVTAFGRAQLFRLPYDATPAGRLPDEHRDPGVDMAEALFGRVREGEKVPSPAIASRLIFDDAVAVLATGEAYTTTSWLHEPVVPRILSGPKPTAFQLYLTQNGGSGAENLTTYFEDDQTTLRGHKLYWHQWEVVLGVAQVSGNCTCPTHPTAPLRKNDKQHTEMRPVKSGKKFSGRIWFDNLKPAELGALLMAVDLPATAAHKIGMGKPLGLGSIRITPTVLFHNRRTRYSAWTESPAEPKPDPERAVGARNAFLAVLREHLTTSYEQGQANLSTDGKRIAGVPRLDVLYHLLEWEQRPDLRHASTIPRLRSTKVTSMRLPEFKERQVLPTPHAVAGQPEPEWRANPPRRGQTAPQLAQPTTKTASATPPPDPQLQEIWTGDATYTRNNGALRVEFADGRRVEAPRDEAAGLLAAWDPPTLIRLKERGRAVRVNATVSHAGAGSGIRLLKVVPA